MAEGARKMDPRTALRLHYWLWNRQYLGVPLIPLIFCWLPILYPTPIGYTAYVIIIMAFYWCLELLPLAATALLPMVLFPFFGVLESGEVCSQYLKDTNVLFLGGMMVAIAIEDWELHRRIALKVLLLMGTEPVWLMAGMMATTAFLSMWMSNTATTAMMVPIANAVLDQLRETQSDDQENDNHVTSEQPYDAKMVKVEVNGGYHEDGVRDVESGTGGTGGEKEVLKSEDELSDIEDKSVEIVIKPAPKSVKDSQEYRYDRMVKGVTLAVPYAANIGGTATITGTGPNLVLINQIDSLYGPEANVSFGTWMMMALPCMLICLLFAWLWLQFLFLDSFRFWKKKEPQSKEQKVKVRAVIQKAYGELGPMSFAEIAVLVHFVLLIMLWLTRDPELFPGWSIIFIDGYVTDATTVMAVCMVLFCFPSEPLGFLYRPIAADKVPSNPEEKNMEKQTKSIRPLLNWKVVENKMSWGVLFLLGGGAAMAEACKESGLSEWLGEQLTVFGSFPPGVMVLIITFIIGAFTEITSNIATATIFLPIFAELAVGLGVNPLYIMIPATLACSYAFMLPVATPPNAIAFSHGRISVMDMVKTGFTLNIVCILVANFTINTFGVWVFDVKTFPDWAEDATTAAPTQGIINCTEYYQTIPSTIQLSV